jgi:hypothetical protein
VIVTEAEAKMMRCCVFDQVCRAANCMAWRWAATPSLHPEERTGFCGRAGKPDDPTA